MNKLKLYAKQYLWLLVLIGLFTVGASVFFIAGIYQEKEFDKSVNSQVNAANKSIQESRNELAFLFIK